MTERQHLSGALYGTWPKDFRKKLYDSNNGHCIYCGKKMTLGGITRDCMVVEHLNTTLLEDDNLVPACKRCNSKKWNKNIMEVTNFLLIFKGSER